MNSAEQHGRFIIREGAEGYDSICTILEQKAGYELINLSKDSMAGIRPKLKQIQDGLKSCKPLRCLKGKIASAERIVVIGNFAAIFVLIMNAWEEIKPEKLYWWGFFFHGQRAKRFVKAFMRRYYRENVKLIIFSECEREMYAEEMDLPESAFISIPYGDWANACAEETDSSVDFETSNYYFSGGYSNRDYVWLHREFEKMPERRLVIAASSNNTDLKEYIAAGHGKENIQVVYDVPSAEFDRLLAGAKACIMPFKADTGASGQSVTLRCMRLNKLIIATDTAIMREYVVNGETGLLFERESDLTPVLEMVETDPGRTEKMTVNSRRLFEEQFAYETIAGKLIAALA